MTLKITRLNLPKLWNSEYTIFVNQIINIITKYQPENLHLSKAFNKVSAFVPELAKIKAQELSNTISKQLSILDSERDILFNSIKAQIKTLGKVNLPSIAPHVLVLKNFMNIHGSDIADAPYNAETKRLNDMLADYNAKADVKLAAEKLNMKILFDQLGTVNTTFAKQFLQRTEETSAIEKVETRTIRTELDKALKEFFDSFEFCSREYSELDYASPANELNELSNYYKTQVKARSTRRETGKDVSGEPPIIAPV
jgi:hypothetical protein